MTEQIKVKPNFTKEMFRKNDMDFISLIKEFIDNTAAEMKNTPRGFVTRSEIIIKADWDSSGMMNSNTAQIIIKDNSVGIQREKLSKCFSVGKEDNEEVEVHSLHEHGFGMKLAIWSLGELNYLITKTKEEIKSSKITDLPIDDFISVEDSDYFSEKESGLAICINELNKQKVSLISRKSDISRSIINQLGAIYSNLLETNKMNEARKLEISVILQDLDGKQIHVWDVEPQEMLYKNNRKSIMDTIDNKKLGYSAYYEFGTAADDTEYRQYGKLERSTSHPYHPWNKKIDIVINDRVICRKSAEELVNSLVEDPKNKISGNFMVPYQGKIILREGFKTTLMKDGISNDENYVSLINEIAKILKKFIEKEANKTKDLNKQEKEYNEDLCKMWNGAGLYADSEAQVPICNGRIDIIKYDKCFDDIDFEKDLGTIVELKVEEADSDACYQILKYIHHHQGIHKDKAWLIAPSFGQSCINMVSFFKNSLGIIITLKSFEEVGLASPLSTKKTRVRKKNKKSHVQLIS
jgi:hypothetical protein